MEQKQEFSAGGVVFKNQQLTTNLAKPDLALRDNSQLVFLLGKHSGYHKWVLPKGLIEKGETETETAIRETEEEMGVKAKIINPQPIFIEKYSYTADYKNSAKNTPEDLESTRRVKTYQESGGNTIKVDKTVTFYLMEWVSGDPTTDHGWEMSEAGWFSYEQCLKMMGFQGEKEAVKKVKGLLNK